MAKKRKTRHQKIMAATRRASFDNTIEIVSPQSSEQNTVNTYTATTEIKTYGYVFEDVRKTLLIITIIAVLNIVLYFILKLKIISLFGIVF